jgi:hypothetical protein
LLEKLFAWSDGSGDLAQRFDLDELLTTVAVYWFCGNVAATLRIYQENARQPLRFGSDERAGLPLSYARFPKEIINPPREWVERVFNVARWTEMPVGGHFAALEQPRSLATDIHRGGEGMQKSMVMALLLACGTVQAAEWVSVDKQKSGMETFVDVSSIHVEGGIRRFSTKGVPQPKTKKGPVGYTDKWLDYFLALESINCDDGTYRVESKVAYWDDGTTLDAPEEA